MTRIKLRPGLTTDLGEGSVYESTQDLPVTLTKAKSVLGQGSLCDKVGFQGWRCHLVNRLA